MTKSTDEMQELGLGHAEEDEGNGALDIAIKLHASKHPFRYSYVARQASSSGGRCVIEHALSCESVRGPIYGAHPWLMRDNHGRMCERECEDEGYSLRTSCSA